MHRVIKRTPFKEEQERGNSSEIVLLKRIEELEKQNRELKAKVGNEVRKSVEQEHFMIHQSKLAAMGEMVAAIAHQWRQPLTTLSFILQNIKMDLRMGKLSEKEMDTAIKEAMKQINHLSQTIDDFRDFLKPSKEKTTFDLVAAVSDTLSLLQAQFQNNFIQVSFNKDNIEPINIVGFSGELKQVLINIIDNGIGAIKNKIARGQLEEGHGEIQLEIFRQTGGVCLKIRNNGTPIPAEIINRIFEPFYSKNKSGKGMGIGLYMSKIIIEINMKGKIYCHNVKNGVVFYIELKQEYQDESR